MITHLIEKKYTSYYKSHKVSLEKELKRHQGTFIKVGCGSSFFFCGLCEELMGDRLDKISISYLKKITKYHTRLALSISNHHTFWESKRERMRRVLREKGHTEKYINSEIEKSYDRERDDLAVKKGYFERLGNSIQNFVPFKTRRVVAVYPAIDFNTATDFFDSTVILFEGNEKGQYWSRDEYINGIAKEDKQNEDNEL